jgi:isocitrate dehydrogenase
MVLFRENTEDIYAGIEFQEGTEENKKFMEFFKENFAKGTKKYVSGKFKYRHQTCFQRGNGTVGPRCFGICFEHKKPDLTLVHKGNIMKFTEGSFRDWGYALAKREFGAVDLDGGPWQVIEKNGHKLI